MRRADDNLGSIGGELAECFGKGEVPADEHAHATPWCVEGFMRGVNVRCELGTFSVPEILLLVAGEDFARGRNESGHVGDVVAGG